MAISAIPRGAAPGRIVPHTDDRVAAVAQAFENKAGRYELLRIEGNRAHYAFTNHQGHRTEAELALTAWQRMHAAAQAALVSLVLTAALACGVPAAGQSSSRQPVKAAIIPEDTPTRSITLPGSRPASSQPQNEHSEKLPSEPPADKAGPAPEVVAASLALELSSGDPNAEVHYKTALLALNRDDFTVATDELNEAAKAAPQNAVVLYGLAVVQARNRQPEMALPNLESANRIGLPDPEAARAPGLLAAIRYAVKKNEAEQRKVTPLKLWGSYDTALDSPTQEFEDRDGHTYFKIKTPLSREMFLWKVDGESTIRGHWLEKNTLTQEIIYADTKRHDPKPKTTTEEHWWLVTILINPDGSLDGSRMETCTRETGFGCEKPDRLHGAIVTFKGHVEPNGDITLGDINPKQGDPSQPLVLRKKSRVASAPPEDVHIDVE